MKRILLLGGYGFIGTNLLKYIDHYHGNDYSVVVLDRVDVHPHAVSFECVDNVYSGDYSDGKLIKKIFENHNFDVVIHSLSTTVPSSSNNPRYDIETNLIPAIDLLNSMLDKKVKDIIFVWSQTNSVHLI